MQNTPFESVNEHIQFTYAHKRVLSLYAISFQKIWPINILLYNILYYTISCVNVGYSTSWTPSQNRLSTQFPYFNVVVSLLFLFLLWNNRTDQCYG